MFKTWNEYIENLGALPDHRVITTTMSLLSYTLEL